MIEFNITLK